MIERDHYPSSSSSRDADTERGGGGGPAAGSTYAASEGFSVRGAPWSSIAPDTSSMDDFPDLSQVPVVIVVVVVVVHCVHKKTAPFLFFQ